MLIGNIVLVGINDFEFTKQLNKHGYNVIQVSDISSIINIQETFLLTIINYKLIINFDNKSIERLYFSNNNVQIAILIDNIDLPKSFIKLINNSSLDFIYNYEIKNNLICNRIDKIIITSKFDENLNQHQKDYNEKEILKKELSIREQILKHERLINSNIIGSITSGLAIIDLDSTIILMNSHLQEILSKENSNIIGEDYNNILPSEISMLIKKAFNKSTHNISKKIKFNNFYLNIYIYKILDFNNKQTGILLLVQNITEQENTNIQLYQSEKLATVGTMLAGIAHELRNPLSIINARSQRALKKHIENDQTKTRKIFESIEQQSVRCSNIVNDLLQFTRNTISEYHNFKINDILDETLKYAYYQKKFEDINLEKNYTSNLTIYGDRSRLVQVFLNIILNAVDAMNKHGTLTISTTNYKKNFTKIEITDTGIGIPEHDLNKIFDPFFTTKNPGEGTGLGLSIAFKIIQEHNGYITLKSSPGKTTFTVTIPSKKNDSN